jgi:HAD superfamily hydrolase (TIGR01458 family)
VNATLPDPPSAFLFDLDGVFFVGDDPIPGGADVIAWVEERQLPYLFVTNTTSHPRSHLATKLARCGVRAEVEQILTPAVAAHEWLTEHARGPVALFVPDATATEFGDLGEQWSFAQLNRAFRLLMAEPRPQLIALGMARFWKDTDGLTLDNGPFASALAFASGLEPSVTGKPAPAFFEAACHRIALPPEQVTMVGDDIRGDIGGAQGAALRGVLVRTGKFHRDDLTLGIEPDAVLDSVADLPRWASSLS